MELSPLHALSPLDGRYHAQVQVLCKYFSEYALIRQRVAVEVAYFSVLSRFVPELLDTPSELLRGLDGVVEDFSEKGALRVKEIEREIRHDVKAVEYFLQEKMDELLPKAASPGAYDKYKAFLHFGLTSQDINNTACPMLLKRAQEEVMLPELEVLVSDLERKAQDWGEIQMLARTHGQPATPTLLGREMAVFCSRLREQKTALQEQKYCGKFGGATGGMNAHFAAYPEKDWHKFADDFLNSLGLTRSYPTTQIEHYDHLAAFLDNWRRIQTILIDLCQDMWLYVSMDYFQMKHVEKEVGSSAMPHKINPIDFENAEGNLGLARALCSHLATKLPISRLQRDLTDSTVMRNLGVCLGYGLIALKSLRRGLNRVRPHREVIQRDLDHHPEVQAETRQTLQRKQGNHRAYEEEKKRTRPRPRP